MNPTPPPAGPDSTGRALVNGEPYPLTAPTTVASLVAALLPAFAAPSVAPATAPAAGGGAGAGAAAPGGVAVAIDDAVLPRSAWATTTVRDGDRVEIVTAVQGG
jgi:sulfur carrier protein